MNRTGIFGGTFNPIHQGHIQAALAACRRLSLDRLLLIPTYSPPHKAPVDLAAGEHRMAMCRLAAAPYPFIQVSDIELTRMKPSYTFDTLTLLRAQWPDDELYLIIGSDMLLTFREWYRWQDLLEMATIAAVSRQEGDRPRLQAEVAALTEAGGKTLVLDGPVLTLSSSDIREGIRTARDMCPFLQPDVYRYIIRHKLYQFSG